MSWFDLKIWATPSPAASLSLWNMVDNVPLTSWRCADYDVCWFLDASVRSFLYATKRHGMCSDLCALGQGRMGPIRRVFPHVYGSHGSDRRWGRTRDLNWWKGKWWRELWVVSFQGSCKSYCPNPNALLFSGSGRRVKSVIFCIARLGRAPILASGQKAF